MAKATSKDHPEEDLFFPPGAPPPYITSQHQQGSSVHNSETVISFPEVVVNEVPGHEAPGPDALVRNFDFTDKQIRQGFIRKVYSIIMAQLAVTAGVVAWFIYDERLMSVVGQNPGVFFGVSLGTYLTTALCLMCCEGPRRRVPYNYLFLLLLTLSLSAIVGVMCSLYHVREVTDSCLLLARVRALQLPVPVAAHPVAVRHRGRHVLAVPRAGGELTPVCCSRGSVPYNYLFLLLLTLSLSAIVGVMCSLYHVREVLIAGGVTFVIVLSLTIFAFQTKIDFTVMSGSLLVLCLVLLLFGILAAFTPYPGLHQLYCALGVLVMGVFLVYDTQLIVGGDHRYAFSPEEYVFAALTLYLDIMYIFIRVLRLLR
ncbi:protein lifeguard 2-like [Cydia splendana]|uniref:protein lifeguard 2-like n=1 Tax=Cydia splendana TaxID=1100963 RepID=UPI00300D84EC